MDEIRKECERRFGTVENKVDDFSIMKDTLIELKVIFNQMVEDNKKRDARESKRDEQDSKLTEAINGININLTELNRDNHEMKERIGNIEKSQKIQEEYFNINWAKIIKKGLITLGLLIMGGLLSGTLPF